MAATVSGELDNHADGDNGALPARDLVGSMLIVDSEQLFGQKRELLIRHEGQLYRLKITRNGKLVLNK